MTEPSRRRFFKTAAGAALTGGSLLLSAGSARAAGSVRLQGCPGPGLGSTTYSLDVVNNSTSFVDLVIYQTSPDLGVPNAMSLAWLSAPAWPQHGADFRWDLDYSFSWSETADLVPGAVYRPAQTWPADPANPNEQQVQLTAANGGLHFQSGPPSATAQLGSLYIRELSDIPAQAASVGIGMSGSDVFAVAAQPNTNLVFTPHPNYWLAAGTYQPGEVLDVEQITNAVRLDFGSGTALKATLNVDDTWTVVPG